MILIQQIKAARGLLEWSQLELGERAGLSKTAISNIESGRFRPTVKSLDAIQSACEAAGVEFIEGGVRLTSPTITVLRGVDFTAQMRRFKLQTCIARGIRELLYMGINPTLMEPEEFKETEEHMQRVSDAGIRTRIIVSDTRTADELPGSLSYYRAIPDEFLVDTSPLFVMGSYVGMMLYDSQEVVLVRSKNQADFQRALFEFLWQNGKSFSG